METDPAMVVAGRYSDQAEAYRQYWAPVLVELGKVLIDGLPLAEARAVLDLGTGVGALLPEIQDHAHSALVVGADISEGMLRLAPRNVPRVLANAAALPFDDQSFDCAVMAFMLFHVPEPADGVSEVRRVLRRGGMVAVGTWGPDLNDSKAERIWTELLDSFGAPEETGMARHELTDSPGKVANMFEARGFDVVEQREQITVDVMDLEEFVTRRTILGMEHRRLRALDRATQERFLRAGREALASLSPDDFIGEETAILTWARRTG